MMVKSEGMSTYSAITFTPPSDISVIVQSRGSEPVPNWIFANRLQRRRSLVRRFASISILRLAGDGSPSIPVLPFTEESLGSAYRDLSQFIRSFRNLFTDLVRHPQDAPSSRRKG